MITDNLKLKWDDPEIEDLHGGPEHEIRLQRRQVDFLKFAGHCSSPATFGNGHKCEEASQA